MQKHFTKGMELIVVSLDDLRQLFREVQDECMERTEDERFLSSDEVENLLNISRTTLYRWKKEGYIHPKKIGRRSYFLLSEISKLMEGEK